MEGMTASKYFTSSRSARLQLPRVVLASPLQDTSMSCGRPWPWWLAVEPAQVGRKGKTSSLDEVFGRHRTHRRNRRMTICQHGPTVEFG